MTSASPDRAAADRAEIESAVALVVARAEAARADPESEAAGFGDADLRQLLTAAVRLYAARFEARPEMGPPLDQSAVTATDVAVVASEMIRVADINLFDLSMWHGRPRPGGRR